MSVAIPKCVGEAGHRGAEVRSDVCVRVEPRERGGIDIKLESRVNPYYGDAIRQQAEEVLESLGVRHAQVSIHDEGALPFVIAARIEAATRRAGLEKAPRCSTASCRFPSLPRGIACDARGFMSLAASLSISLTPPCTERTPSFWTSKILFTPTRRIRRDFWCATLYVRSIFYSVSAWCASTSFRWGSKTWRRSFPKLPT